MERICRPELVGFRFGRPITTLSSAVLGGGLQSSRSIINLHVHKDYMSPDPAADVAHAAHRAGLPTPIVGLLTAVPMHKAVYRGAAGIHILATAGVTNAERAGITPPWDVGSRPGTINLIVVLERQVDPSGLCGAVITATEAKVRALAELGIRVPGTDLAATGTGTDAVVVAATGQGGYAPYLGPVTRDGHTLARLVHEAVLMGLTGEGKR